MIHSRAHALSDELRELQGQLGDFNTLVDNVHVNADLEDIDRRHRQLLSRNQQEQIKLDELFTQRSR